MAIKKPAAAVDGNTTGGSVPVDADFAKRFPVIWEFISCPTYEDGTARELASLIFFCEGGAVKCCLSDKDASRVCFFAADTFQDCLRGLEKALATDKADWRASAAVRGKRRS